MAVSFKGAHFPQEIILTCVRWYVAYPLSTRHVEELMREHGVPVDHATVNRWVVKYSLPLDAAFHRRKRPVGVSWRLDETSMDTIGDCSPSPRKRCKPRHTGRGARSVDEPSGQTIDFLLAEQRDERAAKRFLTKAIRRHGVPDKMTIDGSEASEAAIRSDNQEHGTSIEIRQIKYLNNIIEIVLTQLTKPHRLTPRMCRYYLADFDFCIGDDDTIDPQLNQLAPLLACGTV
jgi:putative transposase